MFKPRQTVIELPAIDEAALERLCIAISQITVRGGLHINLRPRHILGEAILQQFPEPLKGEGFNPLPMEIW